MPVWQVATLGVLAAWLYWSILGHLAAQWLSDPNFSHGFIVPAFAIWVVWTKRSQLADAPIEPTWVGLWIVIPALLMLIVGVLGAELFLSRSSLVFLAAGLTVSFQGMQRFRILLFPWLALFLMIPIPSIIFNQITFPLQILASKLASFLLALVDVPVLREGNVIKLPAMSLEVAEACSGIRSLLSLGALAVIYGFLLERSVLIRIFLALASIPIAVAANALRIFVTGILVQYWDPEGAKGFFHSFSGWLIFALSLVMLIGSHQLVRWLRPQGQH